MYLQDILEVTIGLVFLWLIVSLAVMQFQEWIAYLFKLRSKDLEEAIRSLLGGGAEGQTLAAMIYKHPLITGLVSKTHKHLSYIPASKFALALFDIVITAGTESWPIKKILEDIRTQVDSLSNPEQKKLAMDDYKAIQVTARQIASTQLAIEAVDSLKRQMTNLGVKYPQLKPSIESAVQEVSSYYRQVIDEYHKDQMVGKGKDLTLHQIRLGLLAIDNVFPKTKISLSALLAGAEEYITEGEQGLAKAREQLETWFNDAMDRLSGWYKRRSQWIAFILGALLAVSFNLDSISIATSLWREPSLRQAIYAQVDTFLKQNQESPTTSADPTTTITEIKEQLSVLNIPFGWNTVVFDTGGRSCYLIPFVPNTTWGILTKDSAGNAVCKHLNNLPMDTTGWLAKVIGLLITGVAAAQGAPFWFDILKKLINVRSTGPKPDEKPAG